MGGELDVECGCGYYEEQDDQLLLEHETRLQAIGEIIEAVYTLDIPQLIELSEHIKDKYFTGEG